MFVSGVQQSDSVIHVSVIQLYMYPSHSHLDCYRILTRVPVLYSRSLFVICFKHNGVYLSVPKVLESSL